MDGMFQYEWFLIEAIVIGLLVHQLWSVRRSQRKDREARAAREAAGKQDPPA